MKYNRYLKKNSWEEQEIATEEVLTNLGRQYPKKYQIKNEPKELEIFHMNILSWVSENYLGYRPAQEARMELDQNSLCQNPLV
jgi:hypothetical protein